ncbi:hypothetical protein [Ekhidna sp. To15]|uniref:hypothetical protein n=1 Tax=Ekhidna sp. To15 TaxID=3395267 RepID=UPI003F5227B3
MTQQQINRSNMFDATQAYMDGTTTIWGPIPIINMLKNQFDDLLLQITENQEAQQAAKVFVGHNKQMQKKLIAEKADILNDTLEAYAAINANAELESKAAKSFRELLRLRNEDFIITINETIELLTDKLEDLVDYGMTIDQITDLKSSMDNFLALHGKPRQYRIASSVATGTLEEVFSQTSELLDLKMDNLMKRFKRSNPSFYQGYLAARVVVDN